MAGRSSVGWLIAVGLVTFLIGLAGGYSLHDFLSMVMVAGLEQGGHRLKSKPDRLNIDKPSNEEATSAIAKSGRSIDISECKPRQAVPGVTCTGIITTTSGSFAGMKQPGLLSFAKIDGRWEQLP